MSGSINRLIIRRLVVLPHPDGPTRTVISPVSASRSRPSTATVPSGYRFVTESKRITQPVHPDGDGNSAYGARSRSARNPLFSIKITRNMSMTNDCVEVAREGVSEKVLVSFSWRPLFRPAGAAWALGLLAWRRPPTRPNCAPARLKATRTRPPPKHAPAKVRHTSRPPSPRPRSSACPISGLSVTTGLSAPHFAVGAERGREVWRDVVINGRRDRSLPWVRPGSAEPDPDFGLERIRAWAPGGRESHVSCCPQLGGSRSLDHRHFVLFNIFTCIFAGADQLVD